MATELSTLDFALDPSDHERLSNLCGPFDEHLRQIELRLGVEIANRGQLFRVIGTAHTARLAERVLRAAWNRTLDEPLDGHALNLLLQDSGIEQLTARDAGSAQSVEIKVKRGMIRGRGPNQAAYLHAIATHDI
ncbi:MAG: phosphate starvation-inducible protein PhoH, partial [Pseudomonadota bacterium]